MIGHKIVAPIVLIITSGTNVAGKRITVVFDDKGAILAAQMARKALQQPVSAQFWPAGGATDTISLLSGIEHRNHHIFSAPGVQRKAAVKHIDAPAQQGIPRRRNIKNRSGMRRDRRATFAI